MKTLISLITVLTLLLLTSADTVTLPSIKNDSFQVGEKLRYRVTYGFMDAGEAVMEVKATNKKMNGRDLYHLVGTGRTLGGFNAFFKVHDVYESYVDKKGIFPWMFIRRVDEGGYKINQDYTFNHENNKVNNGEGRDFSIPMGIQDMVSSFYYARTIQFNQLKKGDIIEFKCFMDNEIWPLKIKYVGDEIIHIRKGKFACKKFIPVVQKGRYFKSENDLNFWITDDNNRIPILVRAKIPVGTVKLHLVEWSGLIHPLNKVK
ncbi:MAG: DUF3108 domain-containing protein [Flavobacteriia bacterium]|nr:DUF3108 domain-containing protein [Flavobacteriia bacterium]